MRISDWSSDVCSSDLSLIHFVNPELGSRKYVLPLRSLSTWFSAIDSSSEDSPEKMTNALATADYSATFGSPSIFSITESLSGKSNFIRVPYGRQEARREGKECLRPCSSRWSRE